MRLCILAVGHKLPEWVAKGCAEYIKRMPRELALSVSEIKPEPRGSKNREQLLAAEKGRLQAALQGFSRIVVLDERGADLSTLKLAQRLEDWMREGGDTAFIIGGADGIDESLPHAMARLILCEQLYRAVSVVKNHPYHREG
jgi:23S rRNA (pseudouridine1915-N3)-methyltransferase